MRLLKKSGIAVVGLFLVNLSGQNALSNPLHSAPLAISSSLARLQTLAVSRQKSHYVEEGKASWYADKFRGRRTANGETYAAHKLTAAHPKLPLGSRVRVTHLGNNRSVEVKINDRCLARRGRVIDLSKQAATTLGMLQQGIAPVRLELIRSNKNRKKSN